MMNKVRDKIAFAPSFGFRDRVLHFGGRGVELVGMSEVWVALGEFKARSG